MNEKIEISNLFRSEFSKIVSVLCKTFGLSNIQLAEDIVSDTFVVAVEVWSLKGLPENPNAWLYAVAKNKTKDYLKRKKLFSQKIKPELTASEKTKKDFELDLSEKNIEESQLEMLFTVCNPMLSTEAQISLSLRILCGFAIDEIASALLTSKSTINKRLQRAKKNYIKYNIELELPSEGELQERQANVLIILYLLFNEGYYSFTAEKNLKKHLCLEAMRLLYLFLDRYPTSQAQALMALFCFHASRFDARVDNQGEPILYEEQDKTKWSLELIEKGEKYLNLSAQGNIISKYHLEATLAFLHSQPQEDPNKWEKILQVYNRLLQLEYSPITALNRTYALSKANGKDEAIKEALKINLSDNHLYHSLLAELYKGINTEKEIEHLKIALTLAKTKSEKNLFELRIEKAQGNK